MTRTTRTVEVGDRTLRVEPASARKASRALALLRHINRRARDISARLEVYEREYAARNITQITRVEARVRFPPQVVLDESTGQPVREDGELVTFPSAVDRMTEEDWQAAGNTYPVRERAPLYAVAMTVFEDALDVAEEHVYRLLALFTMTNEDVTRHHKAGNLDDELTVAADRLLDEAMADELLELAVVCGEAVDEQFRSKVDELGDRLGNALRLFGLGPSPSSSSPTTTTTTSTTPNGPDDSTPTSSTDSPSSSEPDGVPTPSSTPTTASSSASELAPSAPDAPSSSSPPAEASETKSAPSTTTPETMLHSV